MNNIIIENTRTKDIRPPPCEIEYKNMKFLITDRPTDQTIQNYIQGMEKVNSRFMLTLLWGRNVKHLPLLAFLPQQIGPWLQELKKHKVRDVVRVCEPTYKVEELNTEGISVTDLAYDDGTYPPSEVVEEWFELLKKRFKEEPEACVAVHCVAGLGRAPVLVALALIELGMRYEDAVELIRTKRRGAINTKQLQFLEKYRPKSRLKLRNGHRNSCSIQ